jgi:hypothetical protein
MIPCSCAASSAAVIWFAMGSATASGIGLLSDPPASVGLDQLYDGRPHAVRFFEAVDVRDVMVIQRRWDAPSADTRSRRPASSLCRGI